MIFVICAGVAYLHWIIITSGIESGAPFFEFLYPETFKEYYLGDQRRFDGDGVAKLLNCRENASFNAIFFSLLFPLFTPIILLRILTKVLKWSFACFWTTMFGLNKPPVSTTTNSDDLETNSGKPTTF